MASTLDLDAVIAAIHEAALMPENWPDAVARMIAAVGGHFGHIPF